MLGARRQGISTAFATRPESKPRDADRHRQNSGVAAFSAALDVSDGFAAALPTGVAGLHRLRCKAILGPVRVKPTLRRSAGLNRADHPPGPPCPCTCCPCLRSSEDGAADGISHRIRPAASPDSCCFRSDTRPCHRTAVRPLSPRDAPMGYGASIMPTFPLPLRETRASVIRAHGTILLYRNLRL